MTARPSTSTIERHAWAPPLGQPRALDVFQRGLLNASLLQLAICAPPRAAFDREFDQVYIARLGERVREAGRAASATAAA